MSQFNRPALHLFLDRLTTHSVLSAAEQEEILALPNHAVQVAANRDFVRQGERVENACLVVEGLVGRFDQNSLGARQITALHIPGDMPDLHSVVRPKVTSALQALSTTTILQVPHAALRTVAAVHPALAEALWRDCMVDAAILSQWVLNVGRRDGKTRIAHLLCEMAVRYKPIPSGEEVLFELPMTQMQLAQATGMTPVHVNRMLMALREDGVEFTRGIVRVRNWGRLVEVGDFDASYLLADEDAPLPSAKAA